MDQVILEVPIDAGPLNELADSDEHVFVRIRPGFSSHTTSDNVRHTSEDEGHFTIPIATYQKFSAKFILCDKDGTPLSATIPTISIKDAVSTSPKKQPARRIVSK